MRNLGLSFLLLAGCGNLNGGMMDEEVAWANAPGGRTHAILLQTNGGATTSYGYFVQLHAAPHDGAAPIAAGMLYGAVRSDCAHGVDLRWLSPSTLALRFSIAQRLNVPPSVTVAGRRIRIVAQSGRVNPDAPCGGMPTDLPHAAAS